MRSNVILIIVFLFPYVIDSNGSEKFSLYDKQKANDWYFEYEDDILRKILPNPSFNLTPPAVA